MCPLTYQMLCWCPQGVQKMQKEAAAALPVARSGSASDERRETALLVQDSEKSDKSEKPA